MRKYSFKWWITEIIRVLILSLFILLIGGTNFPLYIKDGVTFIQKLYNSIGCFFVIGGLFQFINDFVDWMRKKLQ